jgi:hypothetical protein
LQLALRHERRRGLRGSIAMFRRSGRLSRGRRLLPRDVRRGPQSCSTRACTPKPR